MFRAAERTQDVMSGKSVLTTLACPVVVTIKAALMVSCVLKACVPEVIVGATVIAGLGSVA